MKYVIIFKSPNSQVVFVPTLKQVCRFASLNHSIYITADLTPVDVDAHVYSWDHGDTTLSGISLPRITTFSAQFDVQYRIKK